MAAASKTKTSDKEAAEAEKFRAEARAAEASARADEALARKYAVEAAGGELIVREGERKERAALAGDVYNHVYNFTSGVDAANVKNCMSKLTEWHRLDPECEIEIRFTSPGGNVIDGMALFDFIRQLSRDGHKITTVAYGYAASMAGILLQAGDHRVIGAESYLLIHEISAGTVGKLNEIKDDVKFYERICARVVEIFVSRSDGKCSRAVFKRNWTRTDWWLDSGQALKLGFVDEVR